MKNTPSGLDPEFINDESAMEQATALRAERRYGESLRMFKQYAIKGNRYAQLQLGDMLDRGLGQKRDATEAGKWLRESAQSGEEYSLLRFARFLESQGEDREAFQIISQLSDLSYSPALYRISRYYEQGFGVKRDAVKGLENLMKAANRGHYLALRTLSMLEMKGHRGIIKIPLGIARYIVSLLYVGVLAAREPDSPNLKN